MTQLRLEKLGRLSYSDTLHRAPSSVGSTTTTLVRYIVGPGPAPAPGINKDRTIITINTVRVKKEKQDTTVMRGILNRSLTIIDLIRFDDSIRLCTDFLV
jgi:hypothetical protein